MRLLRAWARAARSSACGENASSRNVWPVWKNTPVRDGPADFPPELVVQVKALACELPATHDLPLSRWSITDLAQYVSRSGLVAQISGSTIWRWLHEDAIRPWQHRTWIFPRDPDFAAKAGRILDLYERRWNGQALQDDEFVISADEKTSIQARRRKHPTRACRPASPMRVEHEYQRCGAWAYLAALDVHQARVFGRCEAKNGMAPFDRLVEQVMTRPPYAGARRVFWIVDNGSAHRGSRATARLQQRYPGLVLVHGPLHASWLNQIEIWFGILTRKIVRRGIFRSRQELVERLMNFIAAYNKEARPFQWTYTGSPLAA